VRNAANTALFALLALGTASCGARQARPDDALSDGAALLDATSARASQLYATRIRAEADVYLSGGRVRVTEALLVDRPDQVRLETISPMRTTMSVLVLGGGDLAFYDLDGGAFYVGDSSAENVATFAPIELGAADIVRLVLGDLPIDALGAATEAWDVRWDRRRGRYEVVVPATGDAHYELGITHDPFVLTHVSRHDGRRITWSWDGRGLQTYASTDGLEHVAPSRMRFQIRRNDVDIELRVDRFDVNPDLPPELFELQIPSGVRVYEL
jgi:hypothetical protein